MDVYKWGQYRGTTTVTLGVGEDDTPELDVNGYLKVNVAAGGGSGTTNVIIVGGTVNATVSGGDIQIGAVEIKNGVTDDRAQVSTTLSDAASNTQNELEVSSRISGFNGTTWDRIRVGTTTTSSTYTGFLNNLPYSIYNATTITVASGQGIPSQSDVSGNQKVTLATTIAGEDIVLDRLQVEQRFTYLNITAGQATTIVKSGPGMLHSIVFNSAATATNTTTIYDNTAASGTIIGKPAATTATIPTTLIYDVVFATGLTIITATANGSDMTVCYR